MDQIITSLNHLWKILMSFLEIIFQLLCATVGGHSENLIITSSSLHHQKRKPAMLLHNGLVWKLLCGSLRLCLSVSWPWRFG